MIRFNSKFFLALFISLFASASVFADETNSGSSEDNTLGTLHYRVEAHRTYASLNYVNWLHDAENTTRNGNGSTSSTRTSGQTNLNLQYGLSDLFLLELAYNYNFGTGTSRTALPGGAMSSTVTKGLSDPTLTANYRYMGGLTGTRFGNAYVNFTPAIGSQQNANATVTGNNISSASEVSVGTNIYWVHGMQEWAVEPVIHYITSGADNDQNPASTANFDSRITYDMSTAYRYHLPRDFYIQGALGFEGPNTVSYTYGSRNPLLTESGTTPFHIEPSVSLGWKPCNNALLTAQVTYNGNTSTTTATSGPNNSFAASTDQTVLTLTAAMVF